MSNFESKRMKISNIISSKVLMTTLICFCVIWIFLWNKAAIVCYAKVDTDKEKVEGFVTEYFEAHTAERIETLSDYVEDAESAAEEIMAFKVSLEWGVEKYDNIKVVAYPLSNGIDWYTIVSNELIVEDFDIGLPGARVLVVHKQKDGSFVIVYDVLSMDDEENEKLLEEIRQINLSDEVYDINNAVGAAYNDILVQNPDILAWVQDLSYAIELARAENYSGQENEEAADMRGTYVVREGDCLWSIAEEELGDGMYWSSIYEANRELIGDDPNLIYVGWELKIEVNSDSTVIDDSVESDSQADKTNSYSEEKDYTNPYALDTETKTGGYLYAIFEANKGCDADGEWFVDDSDRFTYYEVYNPLNDEYRSAYWEISLSEMKGTDKLAQGVNEYHAELFASQKIMMQEKQKEVTAMSIDDYLDHMNGSHYSADIRTKASFEWGNIFTVVDMEDTYYSTCTAVPANFNKVTGEKYEFVDLFNTENYKEELVEIIRHEFGDTYALWWAVEFKNSFSFAITYHGLLLCENGTSKTLLIEWSELEDILTQEMKTDVLEYLSSVSTVASDLSWSEAPAENTDWRRFDYADLDKYPSYYFFSNAYQWAYHLSNEMTAATTICAYAGDDAEEGTWELRSMRTRYTDREWVQVFFACSEKERELYILLRELPYEEQEYLVMADGIQDVYGSYAYDSSLTWKTYQGQSDSAEMESGYTICVSSDAYVYDRTYIDEGVNAMTDYLVSIQADQDMEWWLLDDLIYIGGSGYLADMSFSNGIKRVHMMIDIPNRQYSVVEVYDTQEENYFASDSQVQIDRDDLYLEGAEADFFVNAYQWHYDPQLEKAAACAVKNYAKRIGLADEEWELTHMYSEDGTVGVIARAKSADRRLSLLIQGNTYQVIADVHDGDTGEYDLSDGYLSYDSEMKWHSYDEWTINGEKEHESVYTVNCNEGYYRHDSIYKYQLHRAMQEYLSSINADKEEGWEMLPEKLFVGCYGSLADAWYTNGKRKVHLVVDVWNKTYAVIVGEEIFI